MANKIRDAEFQALWDKAVAAGMEAGKAAKPPVMVVGQPSSFMGNDVDYSKEHWIVPEGPCGFAWVQLRPGTSAFAKWLKAKKYARTDSYHGGVSISVRDYNQSIIRKEAHADAMAKVLSDAGYEAYSMSRMD